VITAEAPLAPARIRRVRLRLGARLHGARTLEEGARAVCTVLHEELLIDAGGAQTTAAALVRCFKTHALSRLGSALQRHASATIGPQDHADGDLPCLVLLASHGDELAWRSRHTSVRHRVIPLPSDAALERVPMVAAIFRAFNVDLRDVSADGARLASRALKVYDLFHVEDACGNSCIPDQEGFVRPYGIRSVVGFGGALHDGDLFIVLCFMKITVPLPVVNRLRGVALDVTTSFFRYSDEQVFDE
jgi:hypothetical protein